ncbi:RDD family protein [Actinoplanes sp. NPDC051859]|uniref:RDD family protein n=1 Tax=Actinoplanes sp. NPDC051859 TaxID=3363909 RepID=UPI00378EA807
MTDARNQSPGAGHPAPSWPPPGAPGPVPPGWPAPPGVPDWRPPTVPLGPDGRPLADFGTRLLAYLIDSMIASAAALALFTPLLVWFVFSTISSLEAQPGDVEQLSESEVFTEFFLPFVLLELGFLVVIMVAYYFYYVEMMYRSGQTLGKKLMKVRVVPLEPGAKLTRGMAAKRYLLEFVGGLLVPFLSVLDGLWQLWDKPLQQTLHDKVAKTIVIKVAP